MAFDHNAIPKDLRPLTVVSSITEEPRITSTSNVGGRNIEGFFPNPSLEPASPGTVHIFYPATMANSGLVGLGYANAVPLAPGAPAWRPPMPMHIPVPVGRPSMNPVVGFGYNPNLSNMVVANAVDQFSNGMVAGHGSNPSLGNRNSGNGSYQMSNDVRTTGLAPSSNIENRGCGNGNDQLQNELFVGFAHKPNSGLRSNSSGADQVSDEGGGDSVSGKKVKILCSFGGKILPRPSDGVLRYVGGQTRIITLRRDVSFNEFVQKMADAYGQPVVIKYQLPDEDLDALVSISSLDDLDNMMDEYDKAVERSSDGSAKLRVFLFSASELDPSGMVQFADLIDDGQKYVEAVNGIVQGSAGGITRKESLASLASTRNSDFSGSEAVDSIGTGQGDVNGAPSTSMLSPGGNSATFVDTGPKIMVVDPSPAVYADGAVHLGIPVVKSAPPQTLSSQHEVESERLMPLTSPPQQVIYDMPQHYASTYIDPRPEVINHSDHVHLAPQMGSSPMLVGKTDSIFNQQHFCDNSSSHQFIPAVHMTMTPSTSHVGVRPTVVQPLLQPKQMPMENVQLPVDQRQNVYQAHIPTEMVPVSQGLMDMTGELQSQYVLPTQYQLKQDVPRTGAIDIHAAEQPVPKASREYHGNIPGVPKDDIVDPNHLIPIDGMMGITNDQGNSPLYKTRKDILDERTPQTAEREVLLDNIFIKQIDSNEMFILDNVITHTQPRIEAQNLGSLEVQYGNPQFSGVQSAHKVDDVLDSTDSLFSNQDPWNLQQDAQFPPRPNKIQTHREGLATKDPFGENRAVINGESKTQSEDEVYQSLNHLNKDFTSDNTQSTQGSAEELIKKELQAVAEGVAASVFQSSTASNTDIPETTDKSGFEGNQETDVSTRNIEIQHKAKFEKIKTKQPDRTNFGFRVSDGIGCLQIIENIDLEELRELGSGTFGTVYHGKWRGTDVAIKRINDRCFAGKPSEQERMIDDFWNEAIKLADLHHPNVVAFYGVVLDGPGGSVATVTEFMVNGSLRTALQKNERNLDKRKRLLIAMDVAFGMEYLHGKNIVHFDLKSDNLLVNLRDPHRPICKVGDLGLSKVKCQTLISGGVRGTLPWMAPELLNGSSGLVSEKVDVFSFGIVMWELLTGEEPYSDLHYGAIIGGIVSNTLRPPVPECCDPEWRSLMERCWSPEPSDRPNFTKIANELRSIAAKVQPKGQIPQK
ncbi:homeobox protein knotted-1-like LET12-like isoform X1 [Hibiscus syriacus]|uniref:Homeobox protein knotted-1-like LET12-like isoform X1 n=1 Tax=Hibiscus syriacus TaxID=106335 RepID=A0A6A2WSN1_HIBSY|nr:uncharacterized protein LOC120183852 [Hibiscus syriacus]KAE8664203.1 homeobox protein knotted-1-like LET12-like isoform X1 [Hibiscus syriacus]